MNPKWRMLISVIGGLICSMVIIILLGAITYPIFFFIKPNMVNTILLAVFCGDMMQQGMNFIVRRVWKT